MHDIGRKRSKAEERALARMLEDLDEQERDLAVLRREQTLVPRGWNAAHAAAPARPKKARTTIRLDADVLAWFRRLGRGHQARMNAVLRAYMNGVIAKVVEERGQKDARGRIL